MSSINLAIIQVTGTRYIWWTNKKEIRKALQDDLVSVKKSKTELQVTAQKLVDSADKKAKDAEKRTNIATQKVLMIESNAL